MGWVGGVVGPIGNSFSVGLTGNVLGVDRIKTTNTT